MKKLAPCFVLALTACASAEIPEGDAPARLVNVTEAAAALEREYMASGLHRSGIEGVALLAFSIDAEGKIESVEIVRGTGNKALDDVAIRIGKLYRFTPAYRDGKPVAVKITSEINFEARKDER